MNTKKQWIDKFEEMLWQHHGCDWKEGNSNIYPDYPYQLATAYFDWGVDGEPAEKVYEAFKRYLNTEEIK